MTFSRENTSFIVALNGLEGQIRYEVNKSYYRQVCSASSLLKLNIDNKEPYCLSSFVLSLRNMLWKVLIAPSC